MNSPFLKIEENCHYMQLSQAGAFETSDDPDKVPQIAINYALWHYVYTENGFLFPPTVVIGAFNF